MKNLVVIFFLCLSLFKVQSQTDSVQRKLSFDVFELLGIQPKGETKKSLIVLPYASYAEETNFVLGASGNYYFWNQNAMDEVSSFNVNAAYTLNDQIIFGLYNRFYFADKYYLYGRFLVEEYPDFYFGTGNDNPSDSAQLFVPIRFHLNLEPQIFVTDHILLGASIQVRSEKLLQNEITQSVVRGTEPYQLYGMGGIFSYDTRDNNHYPGKGTYLKTAVNYFAPVFGSKYEFWDIKVDYRTYWPIGKHLILGNQFVTQFMVNQAPFQVLPTFGGLDRLRGYRSGQYRDKILVMDQFELRFPIFKRILGATFVGVGNVWDSPENISFDGLKVAFGAGLRYRVNDAKINIRGDGALTRTGKSAYYFTSGEAF